MSGAPSIVEQAPELAQPTSDAQQQADDAIIDLDAGESLLDGKPDDGSDTTGDEPSPSEETKEPEPEKTGEDESEPDEEDDSLIAELSGEAEKPKPTSGSAKLKARLAHALEENERLRQALPKVDEAASLAHAVEKEIGPPPKESDFSDYLAFQRAETNYAVMSGIVSRELKKASESAKQAATERNNEIVETFRERAQEVRKVVKDFDAVVGAATAAPQHPEVAMAILESEKGPHLAYYLSKRPEKVHELNGMPLRQALAEIGRLEARLTPSPKKETKAPTPVPPVKGGAKTTEIDPERLSQDQFNKWFDDRKRKMGG